MMRKRGREGWGEWQRGNGGGRGERRDDDVGMMRVVGGEMGRRREALIDRHDLIRMLFLSNAKIIHDDEGSEREVRLGVRW